MDLGRGALSMIEEKGVENVLLRPLMEGDLRPFYVLYGAERYFIRRSIEVLEERILSQGGTRECSVFRYHGQEVHADEIIDLAQTSPFFGPTRLILIIDAQEIRKREIERLSEYLRDPCSFTCLALVCGGTSPKGGWVQQLRLQDRRACVEFPRLRRAPLIAWIKETARQKGVRLSSAVVDELLETTGTDVEAIGNQIEKMSLFSEERSDVGPMGTTGVLSPTKEEPFWELSNSLLLEGVREKALRSLTRILDQGDPPLVVLSWLIKQTRNIWSIREAMRRGDPVDQVCRELGVKEFKRKDYVGAARKYPEDRLYRMIHHLLDADRAMKSSRLDARIHLERLVVELCEPIGR